MYNEREITLPYVIGFATKKHIPCLLIKDLRGSSSATILAAGLEQTGIIPSQKQTYQQRSAVNNNQVIGDLLINNFAPEVVKICKDDSSLLYQPR